MTGKPSVGHIKLALNTSEAEFLNLVLIAYYDTSVDWRQPEWAQHKHNHPNKTAFVIAGRIYDTPYFSGRCNEIELHRARMLSYEEHLVTFHPQRRSLQSLVPTVTDLAMITLGDAACMILAATLYQCMAEGIMACRTMTLTTHSTCSYVNFHVNETGIFHSSRVGREFPGPMKRADVYNKLLAGSDWFSEAAAKAAGATQE